MTGRSPNGKVSKRAALLAVLLTALGAGCVSGQRTVILHSDGSVDLRIDYAVNETVMNELGGAMMADMFNDDDAEAGDAPAEEPGPAAEATQEEALFDSSDVINEKDIRAALEKAREHGVDVKKLEFGSAEGKRSVLFEARCTDLAAAECAARAAGTELSFSLVRGEEGTYVLSEGTTGGNAVAIDQIQPLLSLLGPDALTEARTMMPDMRMIVTYTVPGDIVSSSAHKTEGGTATWTYDINDDDFLTKLKKADTPVTVTFRGKDLKIEEIGAHRYIKEAQTLVLHADNRVDVHLQRSIHEAFLQHARTLMDITGEQPGLSGDKLAGFFDEAGLRKEFASRKIAGAALQSAGSKTIDGWITTTMNVRCDNLGVANTVLRERFDLRKNEDGSYKITLGEPADTAMLLWAGKDADWLDPLERQMWALRRLTLTITLPGEIVEATAHAREGNRLTWTMDVADPAFAEKMKARKAKGFIAVFKGEGLDLEECIQQPRIQHSIGIGGGGRGGSFGVRVPAPPPDEE